jgi:hypothetical protein
MSLQSNFPKSRKYYFWAIFLCYLITVDPSASDADCKLFGTLAYRMISKAADSVPDDPVSIDFLQLAVPSSFSLNALCVSILTHPNMWYHAERIAEPP